MSEKYPSMTGGGKALLQRVMSMQGLGDLYSYVVDGAKCRCTNGSSPGRLSLPNSHGVAIKDKPILNDLDNKGGANVGPMGRCKKTKSACSPSFSSPWGNALESTKIGDRPALINVSKIACTIGGTVSITDDGQA